MGPKGILDFRFWIVKGFQVPAVFATTYPLRFHETFEALAPARMPELAQRFGFDLTDALAGHRELLPHLFESVIGLFTNAEAHAQHLLLARRQGGQDLSRLLLQINVHDRIGRRDDSLVFDKVTKMAISFFAHRGLQRNRL